MQKALTYSIYVRVREIKIICNYETYLNKTASADTGTQTQYHKI